MKTIRIVSIVTALAIGIGEIGRWMGDLRFFPMAFDDLIVAAALLLGSYYAPRKGASLLLAAWGLFSGLILGLLIPTLDHLLFGPPKESAVFYGILLSLMFVLGLWGVIRSYRLLDRSQFQS